MISSLSNVFYKVKNEDQAAVGDFTVCSGVLDGGSIIMYPRYLGSGSNSYF
jgi:hypothetical protein